MKRYWPLALMATLLFAGGAAFAQTGEPAWTVVESVVAKVDDDVVTLSDLEAELLCAAREDPRPAGGARSPETAVREIVRRKLLVTQARKLKMEVPPEEIAGETDELAAMGRGPEEFWARLSAHAIGRPEIARRTEEVALVRNYMTLKRRSTYIPETEVRAYYRDNAGEFLEMPLSDVRDEIRERLALKKFETDMDNWIEAQMKLGRVRYMALPTQARR